MRASQRRYPVPHRWGSLIAALVSAMALVAMSMAVLPSGRADALDPAGLVARALFTVVGTGLSAYLALGAVETRRLVGAVVGVVRRAAPQPRGSGS
jgi:hypothetical protein